MRVGAHILLLAMLMLSVNPVLAVSRASSHQVECCCNDCCCDAHEQDGTVPQHGQDNERDKDQSCDASCDCGCHFHLNAIEFQFNNSQLAHEQAYFYGSYHNEYHFEYLHIPMHPPRLA
jgi:hypothetical protein